VRPYLKENPSQKWAGGVAQGVALNSNPSIGKTKQNKQTKNPVQKYPRTKDWDIAWHTQYTECILSRTTTKQKPKKPGEEIQPQGIKGREKEGD
jgi:hypothetical protein